VKEGGGKVLARVRLAEESLEGADGGKAFATEEVKAAAEVADEIFLGRVGGSEGLEKARGVLWSPVGEGEGNELEGGFAGKGRFIRCQERLQAGTGRVEVAKGEVEFAGLKIGGRPHRGAVDFFQFGDRIAVAAEAREGVAPPSVSGTEVAEGRVVERFESLTRLIGSDPGLAEKGQKRGAGRDLKIGQRKKFFDPGDGEIGKVIGDLFFGRQVVG
jgi:hypothetical protein